MTLLTVKLPLSERSAAAIIASCTLPAMGPRCLSESYRCHHITVAQSSRPAICPSYTIVYSTPRRPAWHRQQQNQGIQRRLNPARFSNYTSARFGRNEKASAQPIRCTNHIPYSHGSTHPPHTRTKKCEDHETGATSFTQDMLLYMSSYTTFRSTRICRTHDVETSRILERKRIRKMKTEAIPFVGRTI